jgi:PAS domain S-box-containing protein
MIFSLFFHRAVFDRFFLLALMNNPAPEFIKICFPDFIKVSLREADNRYRSYLPISGTLNNTMNNTHTKLEYFFDIAIDLLCIIDKNGILRETNKAWKKILGFEPEEFKGKKYIELVYPDDIPSTLAAFNTIFGNEPVIDFENRTRCKDGSYRWLEWRGQLADGLLYAAAQDITDRKNMEKDIADTLKFNSKIFSASPVGIATYNSSGKCITANKSYAEFFGETTGSILNFSMQEIESSKLIEPRGLAERALTSKDEINTEIQFNPADNIEKWFDCNITPFDSDEGTNILLLLHNITEKKKSETLVEKWTNRFKGMLSNIKMLALILDASGNIEFINDYALSTTGYNRKEALNKNIIDLFIRNPLKQKECENLIAPGLIPNYIETDIYTKNRWKVCIKWSVTKLNDDNNNFVGAALIGENITGFKLYEKILNFRYELINKEYDNDINSLIRITLDKAEELTDSKQSVFFLYNENEETLSIQTGSSSTKNNTVMETVPETTFHLALDSIWAECITQRKPIIHNDYEDNSNVLKLPNGHSIVYRDLIFPVIKEDKIVALIGISNKEGYYSQTDIETVSLLSDSLWNILYKKKTTEALKKSEEQLRASNLTKDKFFSIIAHDLKSPFQGMLGSLQILSSEFDYLSNDDKKGFIKSIDKLSQYTYKLLENLLQWSRIQTEHVEYNIQIINLKNALNDTIELLSNVAASKNIAIHYDIPEIHFVKTDLNVMLTIFRNILSNAIKFTGQYGKINIYACLACSMIEIFVEDSGIGMTEDEVGGLFQIQNQHHKYGTSGETGTGLGLILCKDMIEKIGGSINVKSVLNKGTIFSFTLPKV